MHKKKNKTFFFLSLLFPLLLAKLQTVAAVFPLIGFLHAPDRRVAAAASFPSPPRSSPDVAGRAHTRRLKGTLRRRLFCIFRSPPVTFDGHLRRVSTFQAEIFPTPVAASRSDIVWVVFRFIITDDSGILPEFEIRPLDRQSDRTRLFLPILRVFWYIYSP